MPPRIGPRRAALRSQHEGEELGSIAQLRNGDVEVESRRGSVGFLCERAKDHRRDPPPAAGGPAVGLAIPQGAVRDELAPRYVGVRPG